MGFPLFLNLIASAALAAETLPGSVLGRVELGAGVPAESCTVRVLGAPLGVHCQKGGNFALTRMPPGIWEIQIDVDGLPPRVLNAGVNAGTVTDVGSIVVGRTGAISGKISLPPGVDPDSAVVAIPALGIFAKPSSGGGYLLTGVPRGQHEVVLQLPGRHETHRSVQVDSGSHAPGVDLQYVNCPRCDIPVRPLPR